MLHLYHYFIPFRSNLLETGIETIIHQILNSNSEENSPSSIVKDFVNKSYLDLKKVRQLFLV